MYAICSTEVNDVKNHVDQMRTNRYLYPVFQFGSKKHADLDKNRDKVLGAVRIKKTTHLITIMDGKVHKKTCKLAKNADDAVTASLVRLGRAGLKKCKCMK